MEKPLLSLIIPVYNVEKYLAGCLDSVLAQTLPSLEVICVDDGSTDASPRILEAYARRCPRISILRRPNGGLSAARNTGIEAATGKYLMFLDSDDKLAAPDALERLCARAEADCLDLLCFEARMSYESEALRQSSTEPPDFYVRKQEYPRCESGQALFVRMIQADEYRPNAYLYLLRRALVEAHALRFPEGIYHEDEVFTPAAMGLAERASCTALCGYDRLWREGSIMTEQGRARRICGNLLAARAMLDFADAQLGDADAEFLRLYRAHARAINLRGIQQYRKLTGPERASFLAGVPERDRARVEEQLRMGRRELAARNLRLAVKRHVPERLWNLLRGLKRR